MPWVRMWTLLAGFALLGGCYKASDGDFESTPAETTIAPLASAASIFPHPVGWSQPERHGGYVKNQLNFDKTPCQACHGVDLQGQAGPSCYTCHAGYPHEKGWAVPTNHGAYVKAEGTANCATRCHGGKLDGGISGVSCNACHELWPHRTANWVEGTVHGPTARALGNTACTSCHLAEDPPGGTTGVTCGECHASLLRHDDSTWKSQWGHGPYVVANDALTTGECTLCHGAALEGGAVPADPALEAAASCAACHASYPVKHRQKGWNTRVGHGEYVLGQPEVTTDDCRGCHGKDLAGGTNAPTCYTAACHMSFPHPVPASVAGESYAPWLEHHGDYFLSQENVLDPTCATANCHGVTLEGIPANASAAEKSIKGCGDCHLQVPHADGWNGVHGAEATTGEGVGKCQSCHGETLTGVGNSPSCYTCHDHYPAPHRDAAGAKNLLWGTNGGHAQTVWDAAAAGSTTGKLAAVDADCQQCHGATLAGNGGQPSCYSCHASYPHAAPGLDDAAWGTATGHPVYLNTLPGESISEKASACSACHALSGTTKLPGSNAPACAGCHDPQQKYPHPQGWYVPADQYGGLHGPAVVSGGGAEAAGCTTGCHGVDGSGGLVGGISACTTCHPAYPHTDPAWATNALGAGYPQHAVPIIDTKSTVAKDDDDYQSAGVETCAGCHLGSIPFKNGEYVLQPVDKAVYKDGAPYMDRCYQCHYYPHVSFKPDGSSTYGWYDDSTAHIVAVLNWKDEKGADVSYQGFVQQTCGMANGTVGCHDEGPKNFVYVPSANWAPMCGLCHPGN